MLIFTAELTQQSEPTRRKHYRRLIHRWAVEKRHAELRSQLERAAEFLPPGKRGRVLGQFAARSSDDQVRTAAGTLLLGKALADFGWSVEFEPEHAGGMPDLRIKKGDAEHVVEVRRIPLPDSYPTNDAIARVEDALAEIETLTPLSIRSAHVPGGASMKPLVAFVRKILSEPPSLSGQHTFNQDGVFVVFQGGPGRIAFPEPTSAIAGWTQQPMFGGRHDAVREAIREKLSKYKVPLVVALDFFDPMDAFKTTEEVLLGREATIVTVALTDDAPFEPPRTGRADDGILHHRGSDGARARERLQAVLSFSLSHTESGALALSGRIMTNPGAAQPLNLREFVPMPRLVVVSDDGASRTLEYLGEGDRVISPEDLYRWQHVP